MNQSEAESVKDLAKNMVKALGVITEKECPDCLAGLPGFEPQRCKLCHGTSKVRWKWEPEPGEWCIVYDKVVLIYKVSSDRITVTPDSNNLDFRLKKAIPILPWEEIEKVLENSGYWLKVERLPFNGSRAMVGRLPKDYQVENWVNGKSRQEAVSRSVIQLGKEIDAKSK